ncbi:type II secretion system protein [Vibrio gallicus]|uniref:type II secretion system protein n=1 Tax=Vibrio gallicus TaxID=190897 RepID=UPI0021C29FD9|nr:type II secretion system protein [Vibrio gallicus]
MRKQRGFTLIELVVVIVILGILAVTAAPRFLNLQSDARISALKGVKGSMASAASIYYAKAIIEGEEDNPNFTVDNVPLAYGYPYDTDVGIVDAVQGLRDTTQWEISLAGQNLNQGVAVRFAGTPDTNGTQCSVIYALDRDANGPINEGAPPTITVIENGC